MVPQQLPPAPEAGAPARRGAQPSALQRGLLRLSHAPQPPWLHGEAARRMAERLALIKRQPRLLVDWWSPISASGPLLSQAYPGARIVPVHPSGFDAQRRVATERAGAAGTAGARSGNWWQRLRQVVQPVAAPVSVDEAQLPAGVQLMWSNMGLHWHADPLALLRQWRSAMAVDGFLMFSTLGPGTLGTLREIYQAAAWGPAMALLTDMHDLGDMLVEAGFADPVMDQETLRLSWPDVPAALRELRQLGCNASGARHAGLRTPRWRERLRQALQARCDAQGRLTLEFELVYGHAFVPAASVPVRGETRLTAAELQAMARARRAAPPAPTGGTGGRDA